MRCVIHNYDGRDENPGFDRPCRACWKAYYEHHPPGTDAQHIAYWPGTVVEEGEIGPDLLDTMLEIGRQESDRQRKIGIERNQGLRSMLIKRFRDKLDAMGFKGLDLPDGAFLDVDERFGLELRLDSHHSLQYRHDRRYYANTDWDEIDTVWLTTRCEHCRRSSEGVEINSAADFYRLLRTPEVGK